MSIKSHIYRSITYFNGFAEVGFDSTFSSGIPVYFRNNSIDISKSNSFLRNKVVIIDLELVKKAWILYFVKNNVQSVLIVLPQGFPDKFLPDSHYLELEEYLLRNKYKIPVLFIESSREVDEIVETVKVC